MMIHPATAHFAMVLPVVASVFGLIYLFSKSETFAKISSASFVFAALAMGVVWYTGSQAGPQVYDYLSEAGQATLVAHKNLGLYLAIAMGILALIKIVACRINNFTLQALSVLLVLGVTATTLYQGKMGGQITYNYGMPFKAYMIMDSLHEANSAADEEEEADAQLEVYQDAIDDITMLDEEVDELLGNPKATNDEEEE